jgi:hypothetical protein
MRKNTDPIVPAKVGDRVLIDWSSPFHNDRIEEFTISGESHEMWRSNDNSKFYGSRPSFLKWKVIRNLTEEEKNISNDIDIATFIKAVDECSGATELQRRDFKYKVLLAAGYPQSIPKASILSAVKNWNGGCEDAKKKFVEGLGIEWLKKRHVKRSITFEYEYDFEDGANNGNFMSAQKWEKRLLDTFGSNSKRSNLTLKVTNIEGGYVD